MSAVENICNVNDRYSFLHDKRLQDASRVNSFSVVVMAIMMMMIMRMVRI